MLTEGFIVIFEPILAPNNFNILILIQLHGFQAFLKNKMLVKYQMNRIKDVPPGLYEELSNVDKSIFIKVIYKGLYIL